MHLHTLASCNSPADQQMKPWVPVVDMYCWHYILVGIVQCILLCGKTLRMQKGAVPEWSIWLPHRCVEEESSSEASPELNHVISTWWQVKPHLLDMALNLTVADRKFLCQLAVYSGIPKLGLLLSF
jgi:hypothetical protein